MIRKPIRIASIIGLSSVSATFAEMDLVTPIPDQAYAFLETYCLNCHDDFERKGEISLEDLEIDWSLKESEYLWERVMKMPRKEEMPPREKKQPSSRERAAMVAWLDEELSEHAPIGGASLRRLNRREYANTISELLDVGFELPLGFPKDGERHGFDNQSEALKVSGALLEAYNQVASDLAEKLFPPERKPVALKTVEIPASDFTYAYSSGFLVDGRMRLASSTESLAHSASWPSRFEAPSSGVYEIAFDLSAFHPPEDEDVECRVFAVKASVATSRHSNKLRELGVFRLRDHRPRRFTIEAVLEQGETIAFRYANAALREDKESMKIFLRDLFSKDPALAAAYRQAEGKVARGRIGWDVLQDLISSRNSNVPPLSETELEGLIDLIVKQLRPAAETLSYRSFEQGPALEIHHATVRGPLRLVDSQEDLIWKNRAKTLLGSRQGRSEEAFVRSFLERFLSKAFRRPMEKETIDHYWSMIRNEARSAGRLEDGLHLALRTALTSPYFLYRSFGKGELDSYGLASRLSYFLVDRPPDDELFALAQDDSLKRGDVLAGQVRRLLALKESDDFVKSFLNQWLDLSELDDLTPEASLFRDPKRFKFENSERIAFVTEANMVFREILDTNRPVVDFIDPDFTYTTPRVGKFIYGFPEFEDADTPDPTEARRVSLNRGGRFGGVLGMAGVMMATANGVDTQPVLRGVWVLENIIGDPPPPPPDAVPALTPDTSKAETPRDLLAAHTVEPSCASCHRKIDPLGFVLESFDPVGRWRTHYPSPRGEDGNRLEGEQRDLLAVDTSGVLPDGTEIRDVRDLKAHLAHDITPFAMCLTEKLLTYATGRRMNYSDRKVVRRIVDENRQLNRGFNDLLVAIVDSESFRTK